VANLDQMASDLKRLSESVRLLEARSSDAAYTMGRAAGFDEGVSAVKAELAKLVVWLGIDWQSELEGEAIRAAIAELQAKEIKLLPSQPSKVAERNSKRVEKTVNVTEVRKARPTVERDRQVLAAWAAGVPVELIAAQFGISASTIAQCASIHRVKRPAKK
jgi:ATP/maltotriose-dependent transcriptional regulator MalT